MADDKSISDAVQQSAKSLAFTIHDLLRYAFIGVIVIVASGIPIAIAGGNPWSRFEYLLKALGGVGFVLLVMSVGAVIYVVSRHTVNPLFTRYALDMKSGRRRLIIPFAGEESRRRCARYLFCGQLRTREDYLTSDLKLDPAVAEIAFYLIATNRRHVDRSGLWTDDVQGRFYRQHSENHLVYASSLALALCAGISASLHVWSLALVYVICSIVLAYVAVIADIRLSAREQAQISLADSDKINELLVRAGLLHEATSLSPLKTG